MLRRTYKEVGVGSERTVLQSVVQLGSPFQDGRMHLAEIGTAASAHPAGVVEAEDTVDIATACQAEDSTCQAVVACSAYRDASEGGGRLGERLGEAHHVESLMEALAWSVAQIAGLAAGSA